MAKNPRLIDMTGKRCGMWTIIRQAGNLKGGGALWHARCDCGAYGTPLGSDLRNGKSLGCGCEGMKRWRNSTIIHRGTGTRLYRIWKMMWSRSTPGSAHADGYGNRGIFVCPEWEYFGDFRDWALNAGYTDALSIERRCCDTGYSPYNCIWADAKAQSRNRKYTYKKHDGLAWTQIAEAHGVTRSAFRDRVYKAGWSREKAATTPMRRFKV